MRGARVRAAEARARGRGSAVGEGACCGRVSGKVSGQYYMRRPVCAGDELGCEGAERGGLVA